MSDTKKFPAIGLLVGFRSGQCWQQAVSLTGFGWLMVKQGLTQEAAAPLATAAVCLGSFLSGLLMAILQKGKGLVWGAAEGALFIGLHFYSGYTVPERVGNDAVRPGRACPADWGVLGGVLGMLRTERKRR